MYEDVILSDLSADTMMLRKHKFTITPLNEEMCIKNLILRHAFDM